VPWFLAGLPEVRRKSKPAASAKSGEAPESVPLQPAGIEVGSVPVSTQFFCPAICSPFVQQASLPMPP
jgi:hypothetical protein